MKTMEMELRVELVCRKVSEIKILNSSDCLACRTKPDVHDFDFVRRKKLIGIGRDKLEVIRSIHREKG